MPGSAIKLDQPTFAAQQNITGRYAELDNTSVEVFITAAENRRGAWIISAHAETSVDKTAAIYGGAVVGAPGVINLDTDIFAFAHIHSVTVGVDKFVETLNYAVNYPQFLQPRRALWAATDSTIMETFFTRFIIL